MNLSIPKLPEIFLYFRICILLSVLFVPLRGQTTAANEFPAQPCWQFPLKNSSKHQFASDNIRNIPFIRDNNFIDSIDVTTGKINWSFDAGGVISHQILINSEYTYLANTVKKSSSEEDILILRSISDYSGLTIWKTEIEFNSDFVNKITPEQTYIYDFKNGLLVRSNLCYVHVNKSDGKLKWKKCIASDSIRFGNSEMTSDAVVDISAGILAFSDRNYLYLLAVETGEIVTKIATGSEITAISLIDKSTVIYGDKKGNIRSLNIGNKKVSWTVNSGGAISGIVKTEKGLLVSSFDNFVYMLDISSGRKIWKKRFAGRIRVKPFVKKNLAIIVGDEKNSYFVNVSDGRIVKQISLPENEYFFQFNGFIDEYYFFLTDKRILVYGIENGICQKKESEEVL